MKPNKHWQNLLHRKCPVCNTRLEHRREPNARAPWKQVDLFECEAKCGFIITCSTYVNILEDETHIMRRFLTPHEKELLAEVLVEIQEIAEVVESAETSTSNP